MPLETVTIAVDIKSPGVCLSAAFSCRVPVSLGDQIGYREDEPEINGPSVLYSNLDPAVTYTVSLDVPANCEVQSPYPVTSSGGGTVTFDLLCTGVTLKVAPTAPGALELPLGSGAVTSEPAGIACMLDGSEVSGVCQAYFPDNTNVSLTAVAEPDSRFQFWSTFFSSPAFGDCNESAPGPCEARIHGQFSIAPLTVRAGIERLVPSGSVQVSVVTSGPSQDQDGYTVSVGTRAADIGTTSEELFEGLVAGEQLEVLLSGVSANCIVNEDNPQAVTVVADETTPVAFTVTCSDPEPNDTPVDPAGTWRFTITITAANGSCSGDVGSTEVTTITITKAGAAPVWNVTARGFLGDQSNSLAGTFDENANRLVVSGSYPEDDGTTATTHTLLAIANDEMRGEESWEWANSSGGACPGGSSDVTAVRVP